MKMFSSEDDEKFMELALIQAQKAWDLQEVPVGAVLVDLQGVVIASGCNMTIAQNDPSAHAEICCLRNGGRALGNYRFPNLCMFVTLEPCVMCAMALIHARIARVVFGASDPKTGACGSVFSIIDDPRHNHHPAITGGVLQERCSDILSSFFKKKRRMQHELKNLKILEPIPGN